MIKRLFILACILASYHVSALETVSHVDLSKYIGKWYEIARFDSWFETDCKDATATYSAMSDGSISVVNTCIDIHNQELKQANGRAWVVDTQTNAKLKVSFLPKYLSWFDAIFNGDYWILKLDPNYSVVLVGEPSLKYLWILARTPKLDDKTYNEYAQYAQSIGYNIQELHRN